MTARKSLSLRISVTDRCQQRCLYCMPHEGLPMGRHEDVLSFEEITRFVETLKGRFDLAKVHITGGEPLVRRGIVDLVGMIAALGVDDLALTTNGQLLTQLAPGLKAAGLDRVNLSLDSLDAAVYSELTGGGDLQKTLDGIQAALECGLEPVKINTVVLRGYNDTEVAGIAAFGIERGCAVRFLELMPIGHAKPLFESLFVPTAEVRRRLEERFTLEPADHRGGSSRNFIATGQSGNRGTVGFISSESHPFCEGCTRIRLTSTGEMIACLARGTGSSIRELLREPSLDSAIRLQDAVAEALSSKCLRGAFDSARTMADTGG